MHAGAAAGCETTLAIQRASVTIAPARDHHTTLVVETASGPFLYVFGGGNDGLATLLDDVQRAAIQKDGSLGPFEPIGKLPEPRAGHAMVLVDKTLILIGGLSSAGGSMAQVDSTAVAKIAEDGTIGAWTAGPRLPEAVMHQTCDAHGRHVYCVGGRRTGNYTSDLSVSSELGADGVLAPFRPATALPRTRGFAQSFVHEGSLYVAGGLHRDPPSADFDLLGDVLRARIAGDGALGAWESGGELPEPLNVGAVQLVNGRVYLMGGMSGPKQRVVDTALAASFDGEGRLGGFEVLAAKWSVPRMHVHQTPVYRRWIYSVGGRDSRERSLGVVDIGVFE